MTEFETQVAEALTEHLLRWDKPQWSDKLADMLAPRVAAAILAAAADGYWSGTQPYPPTGTTTRALSALRGETPQNNSEVGGSA